MKIYPLKQRVMKFQARSRRGDSSGGDEFREIMTPNIFADHSCFCNNL